MCVLIWRESFKLIVSISSFQTSHERGGKVVHKHLEMESRTTTIEVGLNKALLRTQCSLFFTNEKLFGPLGAFDEWLELGAGLESD